MVQKAWHPLNDPVHFGGRPFVFDLDDVEFLDSDPCVRDRADRLAEAAIGITACSTFICDWYTQRGRQCFQTRPGYDLFPFHPKTLQSRPQTLVWAHSCPHLVPQDYAFLVQVITRLSQRFSSFDIVIGGYDERQPGDGIDIGELRAIGVPVRTWPRLPFRDYYTQLGAAAIGLQPLVCGQTPNFNWGKTAGKLAAYAGAGLALVATDVLDHGKWFKPGHEILLGQTPDDIANHLHALLCSPTERIRLGLAARKAIETRLTPAATACDLDAAFRSLLER